MTEVTELEELLAKATPGPWSVEDPMGFELSIVETDKPTHEWRFIAGCALPDGDDDQAFTGREIHANAKLIALAPTLAAENIRLTQEIERLREALVESDRFIRDLLPSDPSRAVRFNARIEANRAALTKEEKGQ